MGKTVALPGALADSLHIMPGWLPALLVVSFAIMVIAALLWLFAYLAARSKKRSPATSIPERPYAGESVADAINSIEEQYNKSGEFRQGCHALSAVLKAHVERSTGLEIEEMTSTEISEVIEGAPSRFFRELGQLQFHRLEPTRSAFERMCNVARGVQREKPRLKVSA